VNLGKLKRQLRRELTANPKRAALLGIMILVAVYFWLPLVSGWIAADKTPVAQTPVTSQNPTVNMAQPPTSAIGQQPAGQAEGEWEPTYVWHELVKRMENDPLTLPASVLPQQRDPFGKPPAKVAEDAEGEDEETEVADSNYTPESLGMVLSTTIVGDKWQVAQIDGKTYKQGQDINVAKDGREINFKVAEILPRSVMLLRKGQLFELKISPSTKSGTIEMYSDNN
jgi:hypothetical protein